MADDQGVIDAGMDTGDAQVGGRPRAEAGYAGTETGNDQVRGEPLAVAKLVTREAEELG